MSRSIWNASWSHDGDPGVDVSIIATDEEMDSLADEIKAKNPDVRWLGHEPGGYAMSLKEFRSEYEYLLEKDPG